MITLSRKEDCSGCGACEQVCPQRCISLEPDKEGYWYPRINADSCIDCGLCEKTCPVLNQDKERVPLKVYAAMNKDEHVRAQSASGGMFTLIASEVLKKGGVVFGVKFDEEWNVVFDHAENMEELDAFRRSKYVQAWLGDTFKDVKAFLEKNRLVLFTGTPCQIVGLRHYLGKEYENLLLMDLVCEGVPSPKVWKKYLDEETARSAKKYSFASSIPPFVSERDVRVTDVSFRNKSNGWKKYSFALTLSTTNGSGENSVSPSYINHDSAYMLALFRYLHLRPICYECPFKSCKSQSDITVADYWGISILHPEMDDDKGTSMVFLNTEKGVSFFPLGQTKYLETTYEEAFPYNGIVRSSRKHKNRDKFYRDLDKCDSVIWLLDHYTFSRIDRLCLRVESFKEMLRKRLTVKQYELLKRMYKILMGKR